MQFDGSRASGGPVSTLHASWLDILHSPFFVLSDLVAAPVHVKCEAFNVAGSIKMKPARRMLDDLAKRGHLSKGSRLIESSSGNLGIALAMIAASRGYRFICVTDPNASQESIKMIRAVGAEVLVVDKRDAEGGYLGTRLELIRAMCRQDESLVWINQYANPSNWQAHYDTTAPEILDALGRVDLLFVGAGTTGTLMGCARYFKEHSPATRIIAVDAEGSVTFGTAPKRRRIPGLGTSCIPPIFDDSLVGEVIHVAEPDTIRMCRNLARRGLLVGGSTGTVLAGVLQYGARIEADMRVAAIMPDLAEKYLDTIYNDEWVKMHFGEELSGAAVA
jgi:cysteine synthase A